MKTQSGRLTAVLAVVAGRRVESVERALEQLRMQGVPLFQLLDELGLGEQAARVTRTSG